MVNWSGRLTQLVLVLGVVCDLQGQVIAPAAVVPAGGHGGSEGVSLGWTLGQPASSTYVGDVDLVTAGVQQPEGVQLELNIALLLDGPFRPNVGLMHDSLRVKGLIPLDEPYGGMGLIPVGVLGITSFPSGLLQVTGPDALVDWVLIELRDPVDTMVVSAQAALLQRDGDVVDRDGISPVRITALPGSYFVAVRHRNHLPVMTVGPVLLTDGINGFDLTDGSVPTYRSEAQRERNGLRLFWAGDVTGDGAIKYTGANNDRDPILDAIGGSVPTSTASGYLPQDVTLDGRVKYTGPDNDRDPILEAIGGSIPTLVRTGELP